MIISFGVIEVIVVSRELNVKEMAADRTEAGSVGIKGRPLNELWWADDHDSRRRRSSLSRRYRWRQKSQTKHLKQC